MDLFEERLNSSGVRRDYEPLSSRMRPTSFDDLKGQEAIADPKSPFRKTIESGNLRSLIFWGPPGCGKTTLAHIVAHHTKSIFVPLSAITSTVGDLRKIFEEAANQLSMYGKKTVLFIDEIHRFNKAQQDLFLPFVETGKITLIGATTENPSFSIIPPLVSRCRVIVLKALTKESLISLVSKALNDQQMGAGRFLANAKIEISQSVIEKLAELGFGDARRTLNLTEILVDFLRGNIKEVEGKKIELSMLHELGLSFQAAFDRTGDDRYDTISAFIKSMRASDPDAAIYYLARMLELGEDPRFIARRMVIFASEDIGLCDANALSLADACYNATTYIGMPELRINLSHVVAYLARAPKSKATYHAINKAGDILRQSGPLSIPMHLRNAPTELMKSLGYGKKKEDEISNLPKELEGEKFLE